MTYDLVVVGTGVAATVAAREIRSAGWRVAVVDYRPFGGTCALRGCDPKKILVSAAAAADHVWRMRDKGLNGDVNIDWPALMNYKRRFTDPLPEARLRSYRQRGIDTYQGPARFGGPNTIVVNREKLEAEYILLACGAEPVALRFPGAEYLITSDGFLNLPALPKRILFVGGGYIAAEFAHLAARAGAEVTVVQRGERLLKHFEPDTVEWLMDAFRARNIEVITHATVDAIERNNHGYAVHLSSGHFKDVIRTDIVVHAAGRKPNLAGLALEAGNVAEQNGRLVLNDFLQSTSNPAVFAAGDAAQKGPPLTPVSGHDGHIAAANMLMGTHLKPDYKGVPSVAFTIPPIASVGLGEQAAKEKGLRVRIKSHQASGWFTAYASAEPTYGFKVLTDENNHRILGAHLVGPHADEVINVFALAIRHNLTTDQLTGTMFAYPTGASDIASML